MSNLFVPVEIALLLKEKGFDEFCWAWYNLPDQDTRYCYSEERSPIKNSYEEYEARYNKRPIENIGLPMYQQVLDWFREEHSILVFADTVYDFSCHTPRLYQKGNPSASYSGDCEYTDYYEALNAAIIEAIKLIP
jgi:hypothetical protein